MLIVACEGHNRESPPATAGRGMSVFHLATEIPDTAVCGRALGDRTATDELCPECKTLAMLAGALDELLGSTQAAGPGVTSGRGAATRSPPATSGDSKGTGPTRRSLLRCKPPTASYKNIWSGSPWRCTSTQRESLP